MMLLSEKRKKRLKKKRKPKSKEYIMVPFTVTYVYTLCLLVHMWRPKGAEGQMPRL